MSTASSAAKGDPAQHGIKGTPWPSLWCPEQKALKVTVRKAGKDETDEDEETTRTARGMTTYAKEVG